jgi:hypothetical protein
MLQRTVTFTYASLLRILEHFAKGRGRHEICGAEQYACLFDRPERTLGASGGRASSTQGT